MTQVYLDPGVKVKVKVKVKVTLWEEQLYSTKVALPTSDGTVVAVIGTGLNRTRTNCTTFTAWHYKLSDNEAYVYRLTQRSS